MAELGADIAYWYVSPGPPENFGGSHGPYQCRRAAELETVTAPIESQRMSLESRLDRSRDSPRFQGWAEPLSASLRSTVQTIHLGF